MEEGSSTVQADLIASLRAENDDLKGQNTFLSRRNKELEEIARALAEGPDYSSLSFLGHSSRRDDAAAGSSSSGRTLDAPGSGQAQGQTPSGGPHIGVKCASCEKENPVGVVYQCLQCSEYTLCSTCMGTPEARTKHTLLHTFWPVPAPFSGDGVDPYADAQTRRQEEREKISSRPTLKNTELCNICWNKIHGTRFKCLVCPNVDLCSECVSYSGERILHDLSHAFFPINNEKDKASYQIARASRMEEPPLAIHDKTCKVCAAGIVGVRHKCAECDDYDLCTSCLSSIIKRSSHPLDHVFLPIERAELMLSFEIAKGQARAGNGACGGCGNISGERRCAECWRAQEAGPSTSSRGTSSGKQGTKRKKT